jgi:hypothetical protein
MRKNNRKIIPKEGILFYQFEQIFTSYIHYRLQIKEYVLFTLITFHY